MKLNYRVHFIHFKFIFKLVCDSYSVLLKQDVFHLDIPVLGENTDLPNIVSKLQDSEGVQRLQGPGKAALN